MFQGQVSSGVQFIVDRVHGGLSSTVNDLISMSIYSLLDILCVIA